MHETSKSVLRRIHDSRFATRYFVGDGIDIGAGPDPLGNYQQFFPLMKSCRAWDIEDGNAQKMARIEDASLDFAHSSHCLEHMVDPAEALRNWLRILRPGGHLIVTVPDEDLYEQGVFPSTFNSDHKWTFTILKGESWSSHSVNLVDLAAGVSSIARVHKMELLDATHRSGFQGRVDQTVTPVAECAIEIIMVKLPA